MTKLTAKQEQFCREYIIDLNARQAAIRAGYSEKTAQEQSSRLLSNVKVAEFIGELKQQRSNETKITANWVLLSAKRVFDRCMQDEPVLDKQGNHVLCTTEAGEVAAAYTFNANGANKALELIGKHIEVKAWEKESSEDIEAQPLNITFEVREKKDDIEVTNAKP